MYHNTKATVLINGQSSPQFKKRMQVAVPTILQLTERHIHSSAEMDLGPLLETATTTGEEKKDTDSS